MCKQESDSKPVIMRQWNIIVEPIQIGVRFKAPLRTVAKYLKQGQNKNDP